MVKIFFFLTGVGVFSLSLGAKDLGIHGQVFEIAERDILEEIEEKLNRLHKDGALEDIQKKHTAQARQAVERPKAVEGISHALKSRTWFHDPSLMISKDIKDHKGRLVARAGTLINPLKHVPFRRHFVFIDGDKKEQIIWLKNTYSMKDQSLKVILVKGAPLALSEDLKMPVYFDQGGKLTQHFKIKAVPAVVRQEGLKLRVEEIEIQEKEKRG